MSQDSHPWRDESRLRKLYHEEGLTQQEIAERFGCSDSTIHRYVHKFNLDVNSIGSTNEKIREVDLYNLYWEEELSQSEIAEKCDCSVGLVSKMMKEQSIPVRGGYDGEPTLYTGNQSGYERLYCFTDYGTKKALHHRLLAVSVFGFDAVKDNDVHHINKVQWDNRPSNIELMSKDEHARYHWEGRNI